MSENFEDENYIDFEEEFKEDEKKPVNNYHIIIISQEGLQFDINKQIELCKNIERIQARVNTGIVSLFNIILQIYLKIQRQKFDSATYEINRQKAENN